MASLRRALGRCCRPACVFHSVIEIKLVRASSLRETSGQRMATERRRGGRVERRMEASRGGGGGPSVAVVGDTSLSFAARSSRNTFCSVSLHEQQQKQQLTAVTASQNAPRQGASCSSSSPCSSTFPSTLQCPRTTDAATTSSPSFLSSTLYLSTSLDACAPMRPYCLLFREG